MILLIIVYLIAAALVFMFFATNLAILSGQEFLMIAAASIFWPISLAWALLFAFYQIVKDAWKGAKNG